MARFILYNAYISHGTILRILIIDVPFKEQYIQFPTRLVN